MTYWVTSFNRQIWEASGRAMVESFELSGSCGTLIVQAESVAAPRLVPASVDWHNRLMTDARLTRFLTANAHVIPSDLGGRWVGPCRCPNGKNPNARTHRMPCPGAWFCRHAYRWYRKPVSLLRAVEAITRPFTENDALVWVDADTVFARGVSADTVLSWFAGRDVFYLKGPKRKFWEAGVLGFRGQNGLKLLEATLNRYQSGIFLRDSRWDDSFQFQVAFTELSEKGILTGHDLATDASGHADVVPHSPIGQFITHHKGRHGRILKIFT